MHCSSTFARPSGWFRAPLLIALVLGALSLQLASATPPSVDKGIRLRRFDADRPLSRAGRSAPVVAVIENQADASMALELRLRFPPELHLAGGDATKSIKIEPRADATATWQVEAAKPGVYELALEIRPEGGASHASKLAIRFLPPRDIRNLPYIPEPQPAPTEVLVGAHHCPLWDADQPQMWNNVLKHPERTPALGFYDQAQPEVADWETKWAVEHGISFFVYCWYRAAQGGPVKTRFGSAIHDGLFKSRFADKMKFAIMWENQARGSAGVQDEKDLFENLLPYWIETYFKRPNYLKIDGKPLLFIYRPEFLIRDLGTIERASRAIAEMRTACRKAGFAGLYLLGEYRGRQPLPLETMKRLGLDYSFAYCWPIPNHPTPSEAIEKQIEAIAGIQRLGILPQVITVSQAWSGWRDEGSIWKIPPVEFETLLQKAKALVERLPPDQLGHKMLLLDNWNEWGEGHYIAPYREHGFGYLDAVRNVFSGVAGEHEDLLPEDIGRGPYDRAYRQQAARASELRRLGAQYLRKDSAEPGLVGWWCFDEDAGTPVALDASGGRRGGILHGVRRVPGLEGSAMVCDGGTVVVASDPAFSTPGGLTIECWVKTEVARQNQAWFVNRIFAGGTNSGFRLGLLDGHACFGVPQTPWSHHLKAPEPLAEGRWVHLAGTCDGKKLRLYVDGRLAGEMERIGPVRGNEFPLVLGGYATGHPAHFRGSLDEVRLFDRALSAAEIEASYRRIKKGE